MATTCKACSAPISGGEFCSATNARACRERAASSTRERPALPPSEPLFCLPCRRDTQHRIEGDRRFCLVCKRERGPAVPIVTPAPAWPPSGWTDMSAGFEDGLRRAVHQPTLARIWESSEGGWCWNRAGAGPTCHAADKVATIDEAIARALSKPESALQETPKSTSAASPPPESSTDQPEPRREESSPAAPFGVEQWPPDGWSESGNTPIKRWAKHSSGAVVCQVHEDGTRWRWYRPGQYACTIEEAVTTLAEAIALALSPARTGCKHGHLYCTQCADDAVVAKLRAELERVTAERDGYRQLLEDTHPAGARDVQRALAQPVADTLPAPPPAEVVDVGYYRVEPDKGMCGECGHSDGFDVIGRDGVALSTTFDDRADAEEHAEEMNAAFEKGREARAAELEAASEGEPSYAELVAEQRSHDDDLAFMARSFRCEVERVEKERDLERGWKEGAQRMRDHFREQWIKTDARLRALVLAVERFDLGGDSGGHSALNAMLAEYRAASKYLKDQT